jgi:FlaA1/EpsC-like NDP-sugar epimerase
MQKKAKAMVRKSIVRWLFLGATQIATFCLSGLVAFLLRFDLSIPAACLRFIYVAIPIWVVVKSLTFHFADLDRRGYRYVSVSDAFRLLCANVIGTSISFGLILGLTTGFPRSIYLIDLIVCVTATAGLRVGVRIFAESASSGNDTHPKKRTLIYGAGDAGITLLREIRNNPKLAYDVRGFIDDSLEKKGILINGIPVLGGGDTINPLVPHSNDADP